VNAIMVLIIAIERQIPQNLFCKRVIFQFPLTQTDWLIGGKKHSWLAGWLVGWLTGWLGQRSCGNVAVTHGNELGNQLGDGNQRESRVLRRPKAIDRGY
jgi:hypothetical protein